MAAEATTSVMVAQTPRLLVPVSMASYRARSSWGGRHVEQVIEEDRMVRTDLADIDQRTNPTGGNIPHGRHRIRSQDDTADHRAHRIAPAFCAKVQHQTAMAHEAIQSGTVLKFLDEARLTEASFTANVYDATSTDFQTSCHCSRKLTQLAHAPHEATFADRCMSRSQQPPGSHR
jgi:hypothetical protein